MFLFVQNIGTSSLHSLGINQCAFWRFMVRTPIPSCYSPTSVCSFWVLCPTMFVFNIQLSASLLEGNKLTMKCTRNIAATCHASTWTGKNQQEKWRTGNQHEWAKRPHKYGHINDLRNWIWFLYSIFDEGAWMNIKAPCSFIKIHIPHILSIYHSNSHVSSHFIKYCISTHFWNVRENSQALSVVQLKYT